MVSFLSGKYNFYATLNTNFCFGLAYAFALPEAGSWGGHGGNPEEGNSLTGRNMGFRMIS